MLCSFNGLLLQYSKSSRILPDPDLCANNYPLSFHSLYNAPGACGVTASFYSFLNKNCIRGSTQNSYSFSYPQVLLMHNPFLTLTRIICPTYFYKFWFSTIFPAQIIFYSDTTCTTVNRTETIPSTCVPVAQYPANNQVAAQWYYGYVACC